MKAIHVTPNSAASGIYSLVPVEKMIASARKLRQTYSVTPGVPLFRREFGFYSLDWEPDIPGKYTVVATFVGSESYYASYSETAFTVTEPEATPEPTPTPASAADLYFVPATAGIIVAIIVVGLLLFLLLRKR